MLNSHSLVRSVLRMGYSHNGFILVPMCRGLGGSEKPYA